MAGKKGNYRVDIEDIENQFISKGLQMLETKYLGVNHPMKFYCYKHKIVGEVKWTNFKQGKGGCKECGNDSKKKKARTSYGSVKSYVEERGYKLISEHYINNKEKINIECNVHGEFSISFDAFKNQEQECKKCATERNAISQTLSYESVKREFEERGCILISESYTGCDIPLDFICPFHPNMIHRTTIGNLRTGKCCYQCKVDSLSGEKSHLWRGGITPENKKQRMTSEYRQWRKAVFIRDDYTCQCCNQRGKELNAHHVFNFSDNINLRVEVTNGITMCKPCHHLSTVGSFHHTYGAQDNDIYQLQEYFDDIRSELGLPLVSIEDIVNSESKAIA